MIRYEEVLNPQQFEVVMSDDGPSLVVAGAGSGKTLTITYKVARLIERNVEPFRILLLTFTNKAAREMLERASRICGTDLTSNEFSGTFHHFSSIILRRDGNKIGIKTNFRIIDKEDSIHLLDESVREFESKNHIKKLPKGRVISEVIGFIRNRKLSIEDGVREHFPYLMDYIDYIIQIYRKYCKKKMEAHLLDFEDLLERACELLQDCEEVRRKYSEFFKYVLVDEYQDVNILQADIVYALTAESRNVMVVGDDCQSIYSFRGADYKSLFRFMKLYPEAKIFKLEYNYRSLPQIVGLSNSFMNYMNTVIKKELKPVRSGNRMPFLVSTRDANAQAEFVLDEIISLLRSGEKASDIAVLYRNHMNSNEVQVLLASHKIPFEVRSGLRFQERAHIKDITAFLRAVNNPLDSVSMTRVLTSVSGLGRRYSDRIMRIIAMKKDIRGVLQELSFLPIKVREGVSELFSVMFYAKEMLAQGIDKAINFFVKNWYEDYMVRNYPDYYERMDDIYELQNIAKEFNNLDEFLDAITLENVENKQKSEGVVLSTIHQAKGLEWEHVFLIWLVDGVLPYRLMMDGERLEEERRLFYVGVTRAKDTLYMVYPRTIRGECVKRSRFLDELSPEYYTMVNL